jgi:hypothetical protein
MSRLSLISLTIEYFKSKGYKVEKVNRIDKPYNTPKLDLIVYKGQKKYPVLVKDWKRTVGVNVIIKFDNYTEKKKFSNPIFIANYLSAHVKAYATRRGITILNRLELERHLR